MKLKNFDITGTIERAKALLDSEEQLSPVIKSMIEMLLMIITSLIGKSSLTSRNSSKPPAQDPNRNKQKKAKGKNKPGGQPGRNGVNLKPVEKPDKTIKIKVNKHQLPPGDYHSVGFESRQVVDIKISRVVTEYQAEIVEDSQGNRYMAPFPEGLTRPIQYGQSIKAHSVYMSQFQLIPYERVADYFANEMQIPISVGSLFNFNEEAFERLDEFDTLAKENLKSANLIHADETGINLNGKRFWLHNASNELWTYFYPHKKRGTEAMDEIGILPNFSGVLIHDHWKPYYTYIDCRHALCNAHHLRELQWVIDNHSYIWPQKMQDLLLKMNETVKKSATGAVSKKTSKAYRERYRLIIKEGLAEMPQSEKILDVNGTKKRGREKKTKEQNLLERLRDFEEDVLRFTDVDYVPFTNNRGENDIRMTKVQQKISGCFKSLDGAKIFCRVRSYLLTAQKHGISPTEALKLLFSGKLPDVFYANSG